MVAEVQRMYCPECDENFTLGVEANEKQLVILCGCDGAQTLDSFVNMYLEGLEDDDGNVENGGQVPGGRMFQ